jgi:hypothetical protein
MGKPMHDDLKELGGKLLADTARFPHAERVTFVSRIAATVLTSACLAIKPEARDELIKLVLEEIERDTKKAVTIMTQLNREKEQANG